MKKIFIIILCLFIISGCTAQISSKIGTNNSDIGFDSNDNIVFRNPNTHYTKFVT